MCLYISSQSICLFVCNFLILSALRCILCLFFSPNEFCPSVRLCVCFLSLCSSAYILSVCLFVLWPSVSMHSVCGHILLQFVCPHYGICLNVSFSSAILSAYKYILPAYQIYLNIFFCLNVFCCLPVFFYVFRLSTSPFIHMHSVSFSAFYQTQIVCIYMYSARIFCQLT